MTRPLATILRVVAVLLVTVSAGLAQEKTDYDLRGATFAVPADWQVTYSQRDQEYDFASPDGRFVLWARWWFPDEPLLGFDDIVRHEKRSMAGQEALFMHLESGGERTLQVAFLTKDEEGEIFLWQLSSSRASLAEHEAMFDELLAGLTLNRQAAVAAVKAPDPAPTGALAGGAMFRDPQGAFGLPLPQGWSVQTTASPGLSQAVLVSPARDAMLLASVARPDRVMTAAQVLDEHMGVLYRDALVVKSIEDEAYPDIAGTTVHAIETIAKVYAINGIAMPYARGRVWIYRADETAARAPFLMVAIRPENAAPELAGALERIAMGFTLNLEAEGAPAGEPLVLQAVAQGGAVAGLVFDGKSLAGLVPFAFNGVDFEGHAQLTGNALALSFPDGKGWAKLGLATPGAVVRMPMRNSDEVQRITAILDADRSSGISFALVAPEDAGDDPWEGHDLRFQFSTTGEGDGKLDVTIREPKQSLTAYFPWPEGETVLNLLLRPDQVLEVRDGSGTQLAELETDADFGGREWALQTYVQVHRKNRAASLVLSRVSVDRVPFEPSPKVDDIARVPRAAVIFDGYALGRIWQPVSRYKSEIAKFVHLSGGALRVGWSDVDKGSWAGMFTPEAVLWLDRFTGTAEARVDLALDGAATGDFEIALSSRYSLPGNLSGNGSYVLRFTRQQDGTFNALSALRGKEKDGIGAVGLAAIPDRLSLILTPGGVRVEGAGLPEGVLPFAQIEDGVGFRIAIHARSGIDKAGALVLRGLRVATRPGDGPGPAAPVGGAEPLPGVVLFDGQPGDGWEGRSQGNAEFAALAIQRPDGLTLTRRAPVPDWSRIALVGSKTVADLDYRVGITPYELVLKLDPEAGLGTRIFLHTNPARYEDAAKAVLTLRELTEGAEVGGLEVQLHTAHFSYERWRRVLPAGQWRERWDGTVRLRLGPDWIAAALGDDWLMRGARGSSRFMMAITPGGAAKTDSGNVTLHRITGGWVTPDGMTPAQRFELVDTEDFDADAFLMELGDRLPERNE